MGGDLAAGVGAEVTGLALAPDQTPSLFELAGVERLITSLIVDLREAAAVETAVAGRSFDLVLHMAAQPIVRTAIEDPVATFASNIMGTANLLQALRTQAALQAVLVVTSDKVYANAETGRAFVEGDALGGKDPYSASKAAAEIAVQSFAKSYFDAAGVPLATARGGNVIGGGDYSRDRLVADIVRAARGQQPVVLRHPEATRPWQHVLDCLAGYLTQLQALAADPATPRALNFGPRPGGPQVTVGELATSASRPWARSPWRPRAGPASIEAKSLAIDADAGRPPTGLPKPAGRAGRRGARPWTGTAARRTARAALDLCKGEIADYEGAA